MGGHIPWEGRSCGRADPVGGQIPWEDGSRGRTDPVGGQIPLEVRYHDPVGRQIPWEGRTCRLCNNFYQFQILVQVLHFAVRFAIATLQ